MTVNGYFWKSAFSFYHQIGHRHHNASHCTWYHHILGSQCFCDIWKQRAWSDDCSGGGTVALDSCPLNAGNTAGCYWKLYFSSKSRHLLTVIKGLRGHVYSNCRENIIAENICDTVSASSSCLCNYLRHHTDTWVPISVGAGFFVRALSECVHFRILVRREGGWQPEDSVFSCFLGSARRALRELLVRAGRFA